MKNNFDFLRLFAAFCVLVSHQYALLNMPDPMPLLGGPLGAMGVYIFFSISGYLITKSWMHDPNILRFCWKRFLRIWPGLTVVTLLCAFVLGPAVTVFPLSQYFRSPHFTAYFYALRLHIVFFLPGVFLHNPYPNAVNGSLWSIPVEVKCYLMTILAGILKLFRWKWVTLGIVIALAIYYFLWLDSPAVNMRDQMIRFGLFFSAGACLYLFSALGKSGRLGRLFLLIFGIFALIFHCPFVAAWLLIPLMTVVIGVASTPLLREAGRWGDLSYGVYIFAFPVQQTLIWASHARFSVSIYLCLSIIITLICAFLSWHLIESPALRLKNRFFSKSA